MLVLLLCAASALPPDIDERASASPGAHEQQLDPVDPDPDPVRPPRTGNGGAVAVAVGAAASVVAGAACLGFTALYPQAVSSPLPLVQELAGAVLLGAYVAPPLILGASLYVAPDVDALLSEGPVPAERRARTERRALIAGATAAAAGGAPVIGGAAGCLVGNAVGIPMLQTEGCGEGGTVTAPTREAYVAVVIGTGVALVATGLAGTVASAVLLEDVGGPVDLAPVSTASVPARVRLAQRY